MPLPSSFKCGGKEITNTPTNLIRVPIRDVESSYFASHPATHRSPFNNFSWKLARSRNRISAYFLRGVCAAANMNISKNTRARVSNQAWRITEPEYAKYWHEKSRAERVATAYSDYFCSTRNLLRTRSALNPMRSLHERGGEARFIARETRCESELVQYIYSNDFKQ